mmetsp:Transcript_6944/g.13940  ORF Transcript_6944/g.13940 Transcript_6944/m.13940 type:complete len:243 (+) Transcript_6944:226-954(+)
MPPCSVAMGPSGLKRSSVQLRTLKMASSSMPRRKSLLITTMRAQRTLTPLSIAAWTVNARSVRYLRWFLSVHDFTSRTSHWSSPTYSTASARATHSPWMNVACVTATPFFVPGTSFLKCDATPRIAVAVSAACCRRELGSISSTLSPYRELRKVDSISSPCLASSASASVSADWTRRLRLCHPSFGHCRVSWYTTLFTKKTRSPPACDFGSIGGAEPFFTSVDFILKKRKPNGPERTRARKV